MQMKQTHFLQASDRSKVVLNSIRSTIIDLIQKLNDMEPESSLENTILNAPNVVLLEARSLLTLFVTFPAIHMTFRRVSPVVKSLLIKSHFFCTFQILSNKLKMGLMMNGELFALEEGHENTAGSLEVEELTVDTEKMNLNLNVSLIS